MKTGAEASLREAARSLARERAAREYLLKNTREAVSLCSQSILAVHAGDIASAEKKAARARSLISRHRRRATGRLAGYMTVPEQEFTEASALIAVARGRPVPSMKSLDVRPEPYVLGLLDCIGELKRMILDRIRAGRTGEADGVFEVMDALYMQLRQFALYDKVAKEARRKIDVARILVDDARASVTEEGRRARLIAALEGGAGDGI
ncbi:MAG: RNA-binding protein [Nitrosopumilus sp.]|nr:RNA-binding protein [Nitrosopumilus sp.]CAI9831005.1 RNA-binding protein [Nitrosopumilaceae archaeon]MDA7941705.1 RNA-binding protein [Nitrosopumilus sp.]MDA7944001.1 RNA-binding protein [Nitrosopumilus sp.]MDA7944971.1 RNA-binding protein [Nitrosopumilus sp.]